MEPTSTNIPYGLSWRTVNQSHSPDGAIEPIRLKYTSSKSNYFSQKRDEITAISVNISTHTIL